MCSEKWYIKNLTACRGGPGLGAQVKFTENAEAPWLTYPSQLTQICVCFFRYTINTWIVAATACETGRFLICLIPCCVCVCNQIPLLLLLSYLRLGRENTGRCSSPPATDFRNGETREWELEWKRTCLHACIYRHTHTVYAQAYTLTHVYVWCKITQSVLLRAV